MPFDRFGPADLGTVAARWDAAVDRTPDADEFCAAAVWSFSTAESFPDVGPPTIVGDGEGWCGMRAITQADGMRVLLGLDPMWGFATPAVGRPDRAAAALAERLRVEPWDVAVVTGQGPDHALTRAIAEALPGCRLLRGDEETRVRADLGAGFDAWWSRRSPRFRQRLRRLERDAADAGVEIVAAPVDDPVAVVDRLLGVEARSWKAGEDTGLNSRDMADLYRRIAERLAPDGHLWFRIARLDGSDVGYVLGGVRGTTYRGLQLSYDAAVADLGLGHLLQLDQLRHLPADVVTYDLGMDIPYKRRWADRFDTTIALLVVRG